MNDIQRQRNSSSIVKLVSEIFIKEMRSDYDCLVTFTDCHISSDGNEAKISVSFFGDETEAERAWERLRKSGGYFSGRIARKMRLRNTPRFEFVRKDIVDEPLSGS